MRRKSPRLTSLPATEGPLYGRVYRRLRSLILDGTWKTGYQLPSSRALAGDLGISRNTAMLAIDQLVADGWVVTAPGKGAFVSDEAPLAQAGARAPGLNHNIVEQSRGAPRPFEFSQSSVDVFPAEKWSKLQAQLWSNLPPEALFEGSAAGSLQLRSALAALVCAARGLDCKPEQIIVTSSTQASLDLVIRALTDVGDEVWIEDPGYMGAKAAVLGQGVRLVPVPVDEQGLAVEAGRALAERARLAYVTPALQFPTCVVLAPGRRIALLAWARRNQSWIVEDDYDAEARFDGARPPLPLYAEDAGERVIYLSSFNRLLFPALRIAYLVVPQQLVERFVHLLRGINAFGNVPNEILLAQFIDNGFFAGHLRNARSVQGERRAHLIRRLKDGLPPGYRVRDELNGMHLLVETPQGIDAGALAGRLRAKTIMCMALSDFCDRTKPHSCLMLGFAAYSAEQLDTAVTALVEELARP